MKFASRTDWNFEPNRLSREYGILKRKNTAVIDLTESNPTQAGFRYPADWLSKLSKPENLDYEPDPAGLIRARKVIQSYYRKQNIPVPLERIFVTSSTSESYSILFRLLLDPGESVLVPRPSYPLFQFLADIHDAKVATYPLRFDGEWHIDFTELEKIAFARAIVIVNPNNPTGSFLKKDELARLNAFAGRRNLAIISDEVFADYAFGASSRRVPTLAKNRAVPTFCLNGISKSLALPQMKLGWFTVSGPDAEMKDAAARLEILLDTFLSPNFPVQNAFPAWFAAKSGIQSQIKARLAANLSFLKKSLAKTPATLLPVEGGWYAVLRLPRVMSDEAWAVDLLRHARVLVQPGFFYDFEDEASVIISLLTEPSGFKKGIPRLLDRVRSQA